MFKNYLIRKIIIIIIVIILAVTITVIRNNTKNVENISKIKVEFDKNFSYVEDKEFNYSIISNHTYKHLLEFNSTNSSELNKILFEKMCLENINNKSRPLYVDLSNNRPIIYDNKLNLITIGATDYKTVVTCYNTNDQYVASKVRNNEWIKLR